MKRKIAVEDGLKNISEYLKNHGYDICNLNNEKNLNDCEAVIVSGQDDNFMGISDTVTKTKVIVASGKTLEEVHNQINRSTH